MGWRWIVLASAVLATVGCKRGGGDEPSQDLYNKQLGVTRNYSCWGAVAPAISEFRTKKGSWPTEFTQLYRSGLLPKTFRFSTADGTRQEALTEKSVVFKVINMNKDEVVYAVSALGYDLGEMTLTK